MQVRCIKWLALAGLMVSCSNEDNSFVPSHIVDGFLKDYSEQEKSSIRMDLKHIEDLAFDAKKPSPEKARLYIATVGAPGASKSTILENYLEKHYEIAKACVYMDPDQRALKFMTATYWQSMTCGRISKSPLYQDCARAAYEKWRGASNYIANTLLNKAYTQGFSIAHGTTSQSPQVVDLYKKLRQKDYKIVLLMCMSDAENRALAVKQREEKQGFVQSTQTDFVEKEKAILKNMPNYFQYADVIHVYWVEKFDQGATQVATFAKENGWVTHAGQQKWVAKIKAVYEENKSLDMPAFDTMIKHKD